MSETIGEDIDKHVIEKKCDMDRNVAEKLLPRIQKELESTMSALSRGLVEPMVLGIAGGICAEASVLGTQSRGIDADGSENDDTSEENVLDSEF